MKMPLQSKESGDSLNSSPNLQSNEPTEKPNACLLFLMDMRNN